MNKLILTNTYFTKEGYTTLCKDSLSIATEDSLDEELLKEVVDVLTIFLLDNNKDVIVFDSNITQEVVEHFADIANGCDATLEIVKNKKEIIYE
jgi:hypothetical protein